QKGHEVLCAVQSKLPGVEWVINDRSAANALSQEQMADWYRSLDLFLVTALDEGGPLPPLEAMACGVPVVSTDVGLIKDLVRMGAPITVVPPYRCQEDEEACAEELVDAILSQRFTGDEVARYAKIELAWEKHAPFWVR